VQVSSPSTWYDPAKENEAAQKALNDELDRQKTLLDEQLDSIDFVSKLRIQNARAAGASEKELTAITEEENNKRLAALRNASNEAQDLADKAAKDPNISFEDIATFNNAAIAANKAYTKEIEKQDLEAATRRGDIRQKADEKEAAKQKKATDDAIALAKKRRDEILKVDQDLQSKLKDIKIAVSLGEDLKVPEEKLKAFQEAAKQYLKLGFSVESPQLKPVLEQIAALKIQVGAEALRLAVRVQIDEGKKSKLEQLKEELAALQDKQLKVNTSLEFQQIQTDIDAAQKEIENITKGTPLIVPVKLAPLGKSTQDFLNQQQEEQNKILEDQKKFQEKYTALVKGGITDATEALFGAIAGGEDPFAALAKSIGNSLANFVTTLGKDMVKLGTLFELLSKALNALKPPGLKVAVGLALIAFGAAIKSSINKKSENKFATGGFVSGPGSGTSDSIPARLSNGEYVINSKSVKRFGKRFFDEINFGKISKFQEGGLVFRQFTRNSGSSKALVNRVETPQMNTSLDLGRPQTTGETFAREVPYIATTRVSGQDLKIILERADKRFSNAT
jgi:hypothetical protein